MCRDSLLFSLSLHALCCGRCCWFDSAERANQPANAAQHKSNRVAIAKWYANEAAKLKGLDSDRRCRHTTTAAAAAAAAPTLSRPIAYI
jgi:hypothetical protein